MVGLVSSVRGVVHARWKQGVLRGYASVPHRDAAGTALERVKKAADRRNVHAAAAPGKKSAAAKPAKKGQKLRYSLSKNVAKLSVKESEDSSATSTGSFLRLLKPRTADRAKADAPKHTPAEPGLTSRANHANATHKPLKNTYILQNLAQELEKRKEEGSSSSRRGRKERKPLHSARTILSANDVPPASFAKLATQVVHVKKVHMVTYRAAPRVRHRFSASKLQEIKIQALKVLPDRDLSDQMTQEGFARLCIQSLDVAEVKPAKVGSGPEPKAPVLAHGLERVLALNGVAPFFVLPPKEREQFHGILSRIPSLPETNWKAMVPFTPPGKDTRLHAVAHDRNTLLSKEQEPVKVKYVSSTSSTTQALSCCYAVLSNFRGPTTTGIREPFESQQFPKFGFFTLHATTVRLERLPGGEKDAAVYSITSDKFDIAHVLMALGHSMERLVTTAGQTFVDRFISGGAESDSFKEKQEDQMYNYTQMGNFLFRAQIDCVDARNGKFFDVKSRAVAPIRWDVQDYEMHSHYMIDRATGDMNSFQREFFDLIRNGFMKYAFQIRLGRMDGAFIIYHNTKTCLGFEYVGLPEMEQYVFGGHWWGEVAFRYSMQLYNRILDHSLSLVPEAQLGDSVRVMLKPTRKQGASNENCMTVYVSHNVAGEPDLFSTENVLAWFWQYGPFFGLEQDTRSPTGEAMAPDKSMLPGKKPKSIPNHPVKLRKDMSAHELFAFPEGTIAAFTVKTRAIVNGRVRDKAYSVDEGDTFNLYYSFEPLDVKTMPAGEFLRDVLMSRSIRLEEDSQKSSSGPSPGKKGSALVMFPGQLKKN